MLSSQHCAMIETGITVGLKKAPMLTLGLVCLCVCVNQDMGITSCMNSTQVCVCSTDLNGLYVQVPSFKLARSVRGLPRDLNAVLKMRHHSIFIFPQGCCE